MNESFQVICEAPPYNIVKACKTLGLHRPEDVPWKYGIPTQCHKNGIEMDRYTFTMESGRKVIIYSGQCPSCHTIYWCG